MWQADTPAACWLDASQRLQRRSEPPAETAGETPATTLVCSHSPGTQGPLHSRQQTQSTSTTPIRGGPQHSTAHPGQDRSCTAQTPYSLQDRQAGWQCCAQVAACPPQMSTASRSSAQLSGRIGCSLALAQLSCADTPGSATAAASTPPSLLPHTGAPAALCGAGLSGQPVACKGHSKDGTTAGMLSTCWPHNGLVLLRASWQGVLC